MGPADHVVDLGDDAAVGFIIPRPFGPGTDLMLVFHVRHGEAFVIVSDIPEILHKGQEPDAMNMTLLSGPARYDDGTWR
jgi:hypothetical protein